jgi:hypothetical protein
MWSSLQVIVVAVLEHLELMLMLSISDPTLPQYYVMNYCILIACASDDWDEADLWIRPAKHMWCTNHAKATSMKNRDALELLDEIQSRLEVLEEQRLEEFTGLTREERKKNDLDLEEDMTTVLQLTRRCMWSWWNKSWKVLMVSTLGIKAKS